MNGGNNFLKGLVILLTGISGSGKTTLGNALKEKLLQTLKSPVEFIDGDMTREFLESDLGYSEADRFLITKVIVYAAALLSRNGVHVIVANIAAKKYVREYMKIKWGRHIQVFLDADIEECIKNDPKDVYKNAMKLEIPSLIGLDIPYEKPLDSDLTINPHKESEKQSLDKIVVYLTKLGLI